MTATSLAARPVLDGKHLDLQVMSVFEQTAAIKSFTFAAPDGGELPGFVPGSHIVVDIGSKARAYSLTGSGQNPRTYTISVLRSATGRGSAAMHELTEGDVVRVSGPRSAFAPVATARHHLLIAAGIGITPMLSHARAAQLWDRSVSLIYTFRAGNGAHLEDLRVLPGLELTECNDRGSFTEALREALPAQPMGTHLYVCGPADFMAAVHTEARDYGWPDQRLHAEHFGAGDQDPGRPFNVKLARSGSSLSVAAGQSLLEALEQAGSTVPNMCRQGVCGECAVPVLRGRVEHRDLYLTDEEKAANDTAMCCVSRAEDLEMELDL